MNLNNFLKFVKEEAQDEFLYQLERYITTFKKRENQDTNLNEFFQHIREWALFYSNVDEEQIMGRTRLRNVVNIRQVAMYAMRQHFGTAVSVEKIGQYFNRDHSTVIHATRCCRENARFDKDLKNSLISLNDYLCKKGIFALQKTIEQL